MLRHPTLHLEEGWKWSNGNRAYPVVSLLFRIVQCPLPLRESLHHYLVRHPRCPPHWSLTIHHLADACLNSAADDGGAVISRTSDHHRPNPDGAPERPPVAPRGLIHAGRASWSHCYYQRRARNICESGEIVGVEVMRGCLWCHLVRTARTHHCSRCGVSFGWWRRYAKQELALHGNSHPHHHYQTRKSRSGHYRALHHREGAFAAGTLFERCPDRDRGGLSFTALIPLIYIRRRCLAPKSKVYYFQQGSRHLVPRTGICFVFCRPTWYHSPSGSSRNRTLLQKASCYYFSYHYPLVQLQAY